MPYESLLRFSERNVFRTERAETYFENLRTFLAAQIVRNL